MFDETIFNPGDLVICRNAHSYHFTEGKEYVVLEYSPRMPAESVGFTWPAYVTITDDRGQEAFCHASRFIPKEQHA